MENKKNYNYYNNPNAAQFDEDLLNPNENNTNFLNMDNS
jgi:hypothetical protein